MPANTCHIVHRVHTCIHVCMYTPGSTQKLHVVFAILVHVLTLPYLTTLFLPSDSATLA